MKVLVVTQMFWPENFPINSLVEDLIQHGHEVTVLTGVPNYPAGRFFPGYGLIAPRRQQFHGAEVLRVPLIPRGRGRPWELTLNYLSFAASACLLGPFYCRTLKPDVIFVFAPSPVTVGVPAILLRWIKRVPVLFWVQDLWPESLLATRAIRSRHLLGIVRRMVRFIYRHCDRILIQSEAFKPQIESLGVPTNKIAYLPNTAAAWYRPVRVAAESELRSLLPAGFTVLFAGNIGAAQDFETILAAAERLQKYPDIRWVVIGDGRRRDWVESEIRSRGLANSVRLLGSFPPEQMPDFFALADVLLVTLRPEEIFALTVPSKVQAYLACGRPIVGAIDGEGATILRDAGAGIVVAAGHADGLADAVLQMSQLDQAQRDDMGRRGRQYFEEHFGLARMLDRLETIMAEAVREFG